MVGRAGRSDAAFCAVVRPSLPYRCRNVSCGVLKDRIMVNGGAKKRTESASRVIWVSPQSIYKAFLDSGSNRIVATIGGNEMPNPRVRCARGEDLSNVFFIYRSRSSRVRQDIGARRCCSLGNFPKCETPGSTPSSGPGTKRPSMLTLLFDRV